MVLFTSWVNKQIIQLGGDKWKICINCIHKSLQWGGSTTKNKWHSANFKWSRQKATILGWSSGCTGCQYPLLRYSCAIPLFHAVGAYELPNWWDPDFMKFLENHRQLFQNIPGKTNLAEHFIPTEGNPIKIPPYRISANYWAEFEHQISSMLEQGIIRVRDGTLHICA